MIVALLTDFGTRDHFVGAVKGTVLTIAPAAVIVDVSHEIEPQNVLEAAFTLGACYMDFPIDTIFMAIVDPGVGSSRRPIVVEAAERVFVCPDNGILSLLPGFTENYSAFEITEQRFLAERVSTTFHGRDIFAHAVGHLANGVRPGEFGRRIDDMQILTVAQPVTAGDVITAAVIHIDRFGNLITNLDSGGAASGCVIEIAGRPARLLSFYAQAEPGEVFAIAGSTGRIEVSVDRASARDVLDAKVGQEILVLRTPAGG